MSVIPCRHLHVVRYLALDDLTGGDWITEARCYDCREKWREPDDRANRAMTHSTVVGTPLLRPSWPKPTPEPARPRNGYRSPPGTRPPPPRFPKKR